MDLVAVEVAAMVRFIILVLAPLRAVLPIEVAAAAAAVTLLAALVVQVSSSLDTAIN
jgi:hypothetical protein